MQATGCAFAQALRSDAAAARRASGRAAAGLNLEWARVLHARGLCAHPPIKKGSLLCDLCRLMGLLSHESWRGRDDEGVGEESALRSSPRCSGEDADLIIGAGLRSTPALRAGSAPAIPWVLGGVDQAAWGRVQGQQT